MSSWGFAPRVSRLTFSASGVASQLASGEPVRVWGYAIANTGTGSTTQVDVQSADGSVTYSSHVFGVAEIEIVDVKFIADKGIQVVVTGANFADFNAVFFHSNSGS